MEMPGRPIPDGLHLPSRALFCPRALRRRRCSLPSPASCRRAPPPELARSSPSLSFSHASLPLSPFSLSSSSEPSCSLFPCTGNRRTMPWPRPTCSKPLHQWSSDPGSDPLQHGTSPQSTGSGQSVPPGRSSSPARRPSPGGRWKGGTTEGGSTLRCDLSATASPLRPSLTPCPCPTQINGAADPDCCWLL